MRAVWIATIPEVREHTLTGEAFHHLVNVARVKVGEDVLLLDGKGTLVLSQVESVSKREVRLKELKRDFQARSHIMDLALGIPKREALELCLKQATELGFRRIYLVRGAYSQMKVPEAERLQKLLVAALEQSNAAYLPEILEVDWDGVRWDDYKAKLLMDSQTRKDLGPRNKFSTPVLLIVGPEGGFGTAELAQLHLKAGLEILNLPTPILRTPTALATGAGCLLQRLIDCR